MQNKFSISTSAINWYTTPTMSYSITGTISVFAEKLVDVIRCGKQVSKWYEDTIVTPKKIAFGLRIAETIIRHEKNEWVVSTDRIFEINNSKLVLFMFLTHCDTYEIVTKFLERIKK